jgi:hypothetical protein
MKSFFSLLFIAFCISAKAQEEIKIEEAKDHVGDTVHLVSKVFGVKYFADAKEPVTLINIGAAFPNQLLTAVVKNEVRGKMLLEPTEDNLIGKEVLLTGKLELYKGKPQIIILQPSQFQVVGKDGEVLPFKN